MEDDSDLSELSGTEDENAAIPASSDLTRSTKRRSRDRKRRSKCSKGSTAKAKFLHNQSYALKKRDDGLTNGGGLRAVRRGAMLSLREPAEVSHQPADIHFPVKTGQNNHTHELRCEVDALQRRKDLGMGDVVTLPEVGTLILWKDEKQTELVYHRADVLKSEDTESLHDLIQYLMKVRTVRLEASRPSVINERSESDWKRKMFADTFEYTEWDPQSEIFACYRRRTRQGRRSFEKES